MMVRDRSANDEADESAHQQTRKHDHSDNRRHQEHCHAAFFVLTPFGRRRDEPILKILDIRRSDLAFVVPFDQAAPYATASIVTWQLIPVGRRQRENWIIRFGRPRGKLFCLRQRSLLPLVAHTPGRLIVRDEGESVPLRLRGISGR